MSDNTKLLLPALRSVMGDWVYYTTSMKMGDVAKRIQYAREIHKSKTLNDLLQRELDESKHALGICQYLLSEKQRFFNAMVVGVYGGSPEWHELDVKSRDEYIRSQIDSLDFQGRLGYLTLSGEEELFAIDGQHRVCGIKQAIKESSKLESEEVCVIFIAHEKTQKGLQRTRRLFTRLNRYAKPVRKEEIIALDEDDISAIVTRRLIEDEPKFNGKISLNKSKSIPRTDKKSLTTISTLYDTVNIYLSVEVSKWRDFKKIRPPENEIDSLCQKVRGVWSIFEENCPEIKEILGSPASKSIAGKYRHNNGGHLALRPIGLIIVMKVLSEFLKQGVPVKSAINRIFSVPFGISEHPWANILWDKTNKRMITSSENKKVAMAILYLGAGGTLDDLKTSEKDLKKQIAGITNRTIEQVKLKVYFER